MVGETGIKYFLITKLMLMSQKNFILSIPWYLWLIIFFAVVITLYLCLRIKPKPETTWVDIKSDGKVSWNILFKPGTNTAERNKVFAALNNYVKQAYDDYNKVNKKNYKPDLMPVNTCPCDTLLHDYNFLSLDGAGGSVSKAPPKPPTGGSGDYLGAIIGNNSSIAETTKEAKLPGYDSIIINRSAAINSSKKLAIIDSGIDTTLFSGTISNLIYRDTLNNFIPNQDKTNFFDSTNERHGSAVAAIIIKAIESKATMYPKLMILKALDRYNKGSIFSVSCALSFAIQKQAMLINMSLGYYGEPDSILHHYLGLSLKHDPTIEVFSAAGNITWHHAEDSICNTNSSNNILTNNRMFYPACFSTDFANITSVTQLSEEDSTCLYQNYSNKFIQLGVYNKANCCAMQVGFIPRLINYYDGSSFATPVASGLRMGILLQTMDLNTANLQWKNLIKVSTKPNKVTIGGKYIEYAPNL
jgi:Subtilase family